MAHADDPRIPVEQISRSAWGSRAVRVCLPGWEKSAEQSGSRSRSRLATCRSRTVSGSKSATSWSAAPSLSLVGVGVGVGVAVVLGAVVVGVGFGAGGGAGAPISCLVGSGSTGYFQVALHEQLPGVARQVAAVLGVAVGVIDRFDLIRTDPGGRADLRREADRPAITGVAGVLDADGAGLRRHRPAVVEADPGRASDLLHRQRHVVRHLRVDHPLGSILVPVQHVALRIGDL